MVKRVNHLFEQVIAFDNLWRAWRKARQGTGWNHDTYDFFFHLEPELLRLQSQLEQQSYQPGSYRYFTIIDPKPRCISVAPFRDRVVHHALVQVLMPIFENTFIEDSYATRINKGTHKAIQRAQTFCRRNRWYYKMDVQHFFETVDQSRLLELIDRKIKDPRVNQLTGKIISNVAGEKGLPIGNLTSQFFANVYLNPLDHFIKQSLRVKDYLRYMDDFVIFGNDPDVLKAQHAQINDFVVNSLHLELKKKASWLNRTSHGLSFLGRRIFPGLLRHCPENYRRSLRRAAERLSEYERGCLDEERLSQSLNSIYSHLNYFR